MFCLTGIFLVLVFIIAVFVLGWLFTRGYVARTYRSHPPIGKLAQVCNTKLHYVESGQGRAVLMIHGSDGTLFNFKRSIFDSVANEFRAIAVDRPGHGYSEVDPAEQLTIEYNARAICELAHTIGLEKPIVIGYSYGGAVALKWAIEHPDEIGGLVLISPAAFPERQTLMAFAYLVGIPVLGPLLVNTLFVPLALPQVRMWAHRSFKPDPLPERILESVKAFSLRPRQFLAFAEEMRHFTRELSEIGTRARSLRMPVMIFAGEDDIILNPNKQAMRLAKEIPGPTVRVFPATGHEVHYKFRQEILDAIRVVDRQIEG